MARHVRRDDMVIVLSGRDKGRQGRVVRVMPSEEKVVVQGVNVRKKHLRRTQTNQQGGVVEQEMPIHISNVAPVVEGRPTRVRFETRPDGSKVRIAVRNGQQIGPPLKKARD